MSGLAKEFSDRTGYHYKAGIWLEDIHRGLLWTNQGCAIDLCHAPSWSWGVMVGPPTVLRWFVDDNPGLWKFVKCAEADVLDLNLTNAKSFRSGHFRQSVPLWPTTFIARTLAEAQLLLRKGCTTAE